MAIYNPVVALSELPFPHENDLLTVPRSGGVGEGGERGELDQPFPQRNCPCSTTISPPRKRVLLYGILITFLTLTWFSFDILVSFLTDLSRNEQLWNYLKSKSNQTQQVKLL